MEPIEGDRVVIQFGREFIMNTRHFYDMTQLYLLKENRENTGLLWSNKTG